MSTRCHIIIKDSKDKVYVYHHCDGYPEGVGEELNECLINTSEDIHNPFDFANYLEDYDSQYEFENYGIHGDEEYLYVIDFSNKSYSCYDIGWDEDENEIMAKTPIFLKDISNMNKFLIG